MTSLGLALLALGAALAVLEAHVVSYGVLGTAAVVAVAAGLGVLIDAGGGSLAVSLLVALLTAAVGAAALVFLARHVLAVRRVPVRGGRTGLLGHRGELRASPEPVGRVLVDGELWRARAWEGEELHEGDLVIVEHVEGLTLTVRRAEEWEVAP